VGRRPYTPAMDEAAGWIEALRSGDGDRIEEALEAIEGAGAAAAPAFAGLAADPCEAVRAAALTVLAAQGDGSAATVRAILRGAQAALRAFEDPGAASAVHGAILSREDSVADLVPALLAELAGPAEGRPAAARDLETATHYCGTAGQEEEPLRAALAAGAADPDAEVRWWCVLALGNLALAPEGTVPLLAERLRDEDPRVRLAALEALGGFGREAAEAVPGILPLLEAAEEPVAARAALAAVRAGGPAGPVVKALAGHLADPRETVRAAAAAALGEAGVAPRETVARLAALGRGDPSADVRAAAAWALQRLGRA
jgi:HEAT repeat protein